MPDTVISYYIWALKGGKKPIEHIDVIISLTMARLNEIINVIKDSLTILQSDPDNFPLPIKSPMELISTCYISFGLYS